jgi:hypothetical protein
MSPVRYELGFTSQKTTLFIVTAVKTSNLTTELFQNVHTDNKTVLCICPLAVSFILLRRLPAVSGPQYWDNCLLPVLLHQ